jgi:hypothetical protein
VRVLSTEFLGRLLVTLSNLPAIDYDVVLIDDVIDLEGTKGKLTKSHRNLLLQIPLSAFTGVPRGDRREIFGSAVQSSIALVCDPLIGSST